MVVRKKLWVPSVFTLSVVCTGQSDDSTAERALLTDPATFAEMPPSIL